MKDCILYQEEMIDHLDGRLRAEASKKLLAHLAICSECREEYRLLERLYGILDEDRISLPPRSVLENVKVRAREKASRSKRASLRQLTRILIPTFAVATLIILMLRGKEDTVEISVPVANLIEDEEIADIAISGIVDRALLEEISDVEEYLSFDNDEAIQEMTHSQKQELINVLNRKYANGT
jgi:predicted anti-sigma-YlaC factor YlaD